MLTDRENRPALAVTLSAHALMMALLTLAAGFMPMDGALGGLIAMSVLLLYFMAVIGGIAWLIEIPIVRRLSASTSQIAQALGLALFLAGLVGVAVIVTATWTCVSVRSYAGFTLLSGFGAIRQFRQSARDDLPVPAAGPLPLARTVS